MNGTEIKFKDIVKGFIAQFEQDEVCPDYTADEYVSAGTALLNCYNYQQWLNAKSIAEKIYGSR